MKNLITFFIASLILFSCGNSDPQKLYKPSSNGSQGEIKIVMADVMWKNALGKIVQEKLAPMIEYYPDGERIFDLYHVNKRNFRIGNKRNKNIIEFKIVTDKDLEAGISFSNDIWANDQLYILIKGKNQNELANVYNENSVKIQDMIMELELKRLEVNLLSKKDHLIEGEILPKHNFSISTPQGMQVLVNNETFVGLRLDRFEASKTGTPGDVQQLILIYEYPYVNKNQLTKKNLIHVRDSVMKKYLKGTRENSYMQTVSDTLSPIFERERLWKGNYIFEIRGQYSMVNDFRGGPFVSYTMIDEKRNRIITIEGHVFCPKFTKRPFMMEVETMMNTFYID